MRIDSGGGNRANPDLDRFGPSLRWMLLEAEAAGLRLKTAPFKWFEDLKPSESLRGIWWLFEYMPITRLSYRSRDGTTWTYVLTLNLSMKSC